MEYKLVAIDLDDTLLKDNRTISQKNIEALKQAAEKGVKVILASGRAAESTYYYMEKIGLEFPVIGFNGACIYDGKNKRVLHEMLLDCEVALPIIKHVETLGIHCNVYVDDKIYIQKRNKWSEFYKENFVKSSLMVEVGKLSDFIRFPVLKILLADDNEVLLGIKPEMEKIAGNDVNVFFSQPYFLEFTNKYATKGYALKVLAEYYGIRQEEVMAIGDAYNDISMIQYAGLGVCMGNGVDDVKKIADFVTLENDEDGVAHAIERFILNDDKVIDKT